MWAQSPLATNAIQFAKKLSKVTKAITVWKRNFNKTLTYQIRVCLETLSWLENHSEQRVLTREEKWLRTFMENRHNAIRLANENKWRQRAKGTWMELGDRNTKFFHRVATLRKTRNWIDVVQLEGTQILEHKEKAKVFFNHFVKLMGTNHNSSMEFDYELLYDGQEHQLQYLSDPISVQEIEQVIGHMAPKKHRDLTDTRGSSTKNSSKCYYRISWKFATAFSEEQIRQCTP